MSVYIIFVDGDLKKLQTLYGTLKQPQSSNSPSVVVSTENILGNSALAANARELELIKMQSAMNKAINFLCNLVKLIIIVQPPSL